MTPEELLKEVMAALDKKSGEYAKQAEQALKEAQNAGSLSTDTKLAVDKMATEFNALTQAQDALKAQLGEAEQAIAALPTRSEPAMVLTPGQQVIAYEALKPFAQRVGANERTRISIPVRAAMTSPDLPAGVVEPQRLPGIDTLPKQRLFIRDLISPGRTTSPAIYWVQQTGFTNKAAVVPENTKKPESDIAFDTKITPVTTVAHLFKASKQILDDFAQLQSTVDVELRYGLKQVEEQEILFGDGTGAHLHGIVPQASAYDAAFKVEHQNGIDDLRLAMLQSRLARLPATGFVLHMIDWAKIELLKDANGSYIFANPMRLSTPTLWGLPVVETDIATFVGKFLTGAFRDGAQLFDREDANVVISTENNDDFEKNMVTIRCEERLALATKRPEAFVYGGFTVPAPPKPQA